jgi:hypothetical protein
MPAAVLDQSFVERFREPNTPYLSPTRVGDFFGFRIQELAARAHVHRNTPTARPQAALRDCSALVAATLQGAVQFAA